MNYKKNKLINILFWGIICIITLLYVIEAFRRGSITEDEAFSLGLIRHNFVDIINITSVDTHPPLYYFCLKIFSCLFDYNTIASIIFSIIPIIFVLIFGGLWIRKNLSNSTSILFLIIFFVTPPFLEYAVIVRMYSLALAFVFFSGIFAYEAYTYNKISKWVLFCVFSVTAAYTHYFALLTVTIIGLILLAFIIAKNRTLLKRYIVTVCVCIILYLPWVLHLVMQVTLKLNNDNGFAIQDLNLSTYVGILHSFVATSFMPYCLLVLFIYTVVFIVIMKSGDKRKKLIAFCTISIPLLTIIIASLISILVKPILGSKYLIPSYSFLPLFLAIGINEIISRKRIIYKICGVCIVIILSFAGFHDYYNTIKPKNHNNILLEYSDKINTYFVYQQASIAWLTCYFMPENNVVVNFVDHKKINTEAIPWDNLSYDEGVPQNDDDNKILLINKDYSVPDVYFENYNCQYIGTWKPSFQIVDVYMLSKK